MIPVLCRHLLESTSFCGFLACIAFLLGKRGAAARHAVWLIGLLKFAIPASALAVAGAHVGILFPAGYSLSSFVLKLSALMAALGMLPQGIVFRDLTTISVVVLVVWAAGTTALLIVWYCRLRACGRNLTAGPAEEHALLERARQRLGIRRSIGLYSSSPATEPRLLGIVRPTVTIPRGLFERLKSVEFEAVLLHELAHARRWDNLTSSLAHLLVCFFWFHPLLWWMERQLIVDRERACDEMVVRCGAAPHEYVAGILKVCRFHLTDAIAGSSGITGSDLKTRMDLILSYPRRNPMPYAPRLLLAFLTVVMTLLPLAGGYCQQCVSNGQPDKQITISQPSKEQLRHAHPHHGPAVR
jgi:bla regulator protein blaR1